MRLYTDRLLEQFDSFLLACWSALVSYMPLAPNVSHQEIQPLSRVISVTRPSIAVTQSSQRGLNAVRNQNLNYWLLLSESQSEETADSAARIARCQEKQPP